MSEQTNNRIKAGIGTILFHALLILSLFFLALKTPLPLPEEEGVEVNVGNSEIGQGEIQLQENTLAPPPAESSKQTAENDAPEELVDQISEEAPKIAAKPQPKKEIEKKPAPEIKKEPVKTEPKLEPQPTVDTRLLYSGKKPGSSEGNDQQAGDKGIPNGTPTATNYSGAGGIGGAEGISYNLGNRKASTLPKPTYNSNEQGRVNVDIWVDKNGNVVRAQVLQKGTTVSDINLQNTAVQAALRAVFAADASAPEIQKGTIIYNFIKLN